MEAIAKGKYLRGSPQKARLVIDLIRGKNVAQALAILKFTNKRATENIEKCLRSAIANATFKAEQDNVAIDPDGLWVKTCFVDMGPHKNRRRVRPAPQGRAYREQRYYCHITIEVTSDKPASAKELEPKRIGGVKVRRAAEAAQVKNNVAVVTDNADNTEETLNATPVETISAPVETTRVDEVQTEAATNVTAETESAENKVETAPVAETSEQNATTETDEAVDSNKKESTAEEKETE